MSSRAETAPSDYELSPAAEVLARRFVQRWDIHVRQSQAGHGYFTLYEPLHVGLLFAHLRGELTLGTYLLNERSHGRFLVLDADDEREWQQLHHLAGQMAVQATPCYLENSRRGGHLWFFFGRWLPGAKMRLFGQGLLQAHDIQDVELYPKQDRLGKGPGSLVRLPFGVHRKSGRRYGFVHPDGRPLASSLRAQLLELGRAQTVPKPVLAHYAELGREAQTKSRKRPLPRPGSAYSATEAPADLPPSERIKAAVSVRDFVAQFVELTPAGRGLCPFHDDNHPSFSVNDEDNYWYCFACDDGGSVIDFWMKMEDCDFKTAVRTLIQMVT